MSMNGIMVKSNSNIKKSNITVTLSILISQETVTPFIQLAGHMNFYFGKPKLESKRLLEQLKQEIKNGPHGTLL